MDIDDIRDFETLFYKSDIVFDIFILIFINLKLEQGVCGKG